MILAWNVVYHSTHVVLNLPNSEIQGVIALTSNVQFLELFHIELALLHNKVSFDDVSFLVVTLANDWHHLRLSHGLDCDFFALLLLHKFDGVRDAIVFAFLVPVVIEKLRVGSRWRDSFSLE